MEDTKMGLIKKLVIGMGSLIIVTTVVLLIVSLFSTVYNDMDADITGASETILVESTHSLATPITSSEVKAYNDTWINCNSTAENYILVTSSTTESITFWYKNETSDWIFVANSSGINYTNAVAGNPYQYPVYYNDSDYFLCKTDATTFFNGSIDDFRVYSSELEANLINLTYLGGRL